jgi:hypothetical protein
MQTLGKKIAPNTFVGSHGLDTIRLPQLDGTTFTRVSGILDGTAIRENFRPRIAQTVSIAFLRRYDNPISGADHVEIALPRMHIVYR